MYIKMSDAVAYRSENDEERLVGDEKGGPGGITVRTDIKVVQDDM